jgi:putative NADH-flavin reductase
MTALVAAASFNDVSDEPRSSHPGALHRQKKTELDTDEAKGNFGAMTTGRRRLKLFIVGGTGGIGQQLIAQALDRGHEVTALVRTPAKLGGHAGLKVVQGDPLRSSALAAALPGHDAVLSALGPPGRGPTTLHADGARSEIEAMRETGVKRLLVVSTGLLSPNLGFVPKLLARFVFQNIVEDARQMEGLVAASGLQWTVVRPPRLLDGPGSRHYRTEVGQMPRGGRSIDRADVAHFMLDEVEAGARIGQVVGVSR